MSADDPSSPPRGRTGTTRLLRRPTRPRHWVILAAIAVAMLALVAFALHVLSDAGSAPLASIPLGPWTYVLTALMVWGDAVFAVLPGETTLNAASTLAAEGDLSLMLVILMGMIGAIGGDSTLYWIARRASGRMKDRVDAAMTHPKVARAMEYLGTSAPMLLVAGRYVPGMRFVVNATMGVTRMPYRRFLLWSSIGGTLWAIYTCLFAYLVATALAGYPVASLIITAAISTVAVAAVLLVVTRDARRIRREAAAETAGPADTPEGP